MKSRRLVAPLAVLLVLAAASTASPSVAAVGRQDAATSLEDLGLDLSEARARAVGRADLDLVIDEADLELWVEAQRLDPALLDRMTIGVVIERGDESVAARVADQIEAGRDPASLSAAERHAVEGVGGPAAVALDHTASEHMPAPPSAPSIPPAACVGAPVDVIASPAEVVTYFACRGAEPIARPELRVVDADLGGAARIQTALELLAAPSVRGVEDGLYSVVPEVGHLVSSVTVTGEVAHVSFVDRLATHGLDRSIAASTMFLEQVVNTVFAGSSVNEVQLTIGGDCTAFWRAMGGDGCHHASRSDQTNTELAR